MLRLYCILNMTWFNVTLFPFNLFPKNLGDDDMNLQDKVGDYHLEEKEVYIRLADAKPIIESYFSIDSSTPGINSFSCKLCLFAR